MIILSLEEHHFAEVALIYRQGLDTGIATFETDVPNWTNWCRKFLKNLSFVGIENEKVIGWCALSKASERKVYKGVGETTIYVHNAFQKKGFGKTLLNHLISTSERNGFWTLQASIFTENKGSLRLHEQCGFRIVGTRKKIAQRNGKWYDNFLLERRSNIT